MRLIYLLGKIGLVLSFCTPMFAFANSEILRTCIHTLNEADNFSETLDVVNEAAANGAIPTSPTIFFNTRNPNNNSEKGFSVYDGQRLMFCAADRTDLMLTYKDDPRFSKGNKSSLSVMVGDAQSARLLQQNGPLQRGIDYWHERGKLLYDIGEQCQDALDEGGNHKRQIEAQMLSRLKGYFSSASHTYQSQAETISNAHISRDKRTGMADGVMVPLPDQPGGYRVLPHPERMQAVLDQCQNLPGFERISQDINQSLIAVRTNYCKLSFAAGTDVHCARNPTTGELIAQTAKDFGDTAVEYGTYARDRVNEFGADTRRRAGEIDAQARRWTGERIRDTEEWLGGIRQRLSQ